MKRKVNFNMGTYRAEIQDYQYRSRPPVGIRVSGTVLGECKNILGEDCYFYKSMDAMNINEGISIAKEIINSRKAERGG